MEQIGLELNMDKTRVPSASDEHCGFLGHTFGPFYYELTCVRHLGATPSKKAVKRLKANIRRVLRLGNIDPWEEVAAKLNRKLTGWANYFSCGTMAKTRRSVDFCV